MAFDIEVFNKQTFTVMTETTSQEVDKFNAASGGAITLVNQPHEGDYDISASFKELAGLVRRRNVNASGAVTPKTLSMLKEIAVKIAAGTPPIQWQPSQYSWVKQNPELAALVIGEQLAKGRIADMLNAALSAGVAAVKGNNALVHAAAEKATLRDLNKTTRAFGDRRSAIIAHVMHSNVEDDIHDNALVNGENLFTYEGLNISRDSRGKLFIVTDSPSLEFDDSGTAKHNTLSLVSDGIVVKNNDDFDAVVEKKGGDENIQASYQAEWSYSVGVKGYKWNEATGGASPSDTAIGTSTNWVKTATSNKDTAGALMISKQ